MNEAIRLEDVTFSFAPGPPVLDRVSLAVEPGEFLGVVGPNGGGKSTLLKVVLGLLRPQAGRVEVLGRPPGQARRRIGYVPQYPGFPRDFPISVRHTVLMGRLGQSRLLGPWRRADKRRADEALAEAEAADLRERPIGSLSGGQMQRVLIARALAVDPEILLLDEPTASVDPHAEAGIFELLTRLNQRVTIAVVSHDVSFISHYIGRVACLNHTLVCHRTSELTPEIMEALYGHPLRAIEHHRRAPTGLGS